MRLPYVSTGKGDPLLMVHGIISDGSFFSGIVPYLEEDYQVITYDRCGYGSAEPPQDPSGWTVERQADDAAEVLRCACGSPAWVFGNSAGSMIALELFRKYPELVRGLILFEPSLALDAESAEELGAWNKELNGYVEAGRIKKALPAFGRVTGTQTGGMGGTSLEQMKRTYRNLENFMRGELNEVQRYRPEIRALREISVPVRVVVTEEGGGMLFGKTSLAGACAAGWKTERFPGRHNAVSDLPEQCAQRLKAILEGMKNGE